MTDTLTACARAIAEKLYSDPETEAWMADPEDWGDLKDVVFDGKIDFTVAARACLTALAENVSEGMVEAGMDCGPIGCCVLDAEEAESIFTAMIRAAVGERG